MSGKNFLFKNRYQYVILQEIIILFNFRLGKKKWFLTIFQTLDPNNLLNYSLIGIIVSAIDKIIYLFRAVDWCYLVPFTRIMQKFSAYCFLIFKNLNFSTTQNIQLKGPFLKI